jgi:hypothetical protein
MAFLALGKGLPGAPIGLRVFKKEFQVRSGGWSVVFDKQHHVSSCSHHETRHPS